MLYDQRVVSRVTPQFNAFSSQSDKEDKDA
jgi:hypothetical protein